MVRKLLLLIPLSLLFLSLSVEVYLKWKEPVPPPAFSRVILFHYYLPWYLQAVDYAEKAREERNGYWVMRALQEVEEAIKRAPTNGVLWLWAARLRKFLGMRYREFVLIAYKMDPYRLNFGETLDLLDPQLLANNRWLLDRIVSINRNRKFFEALLEKLWSEEEGREFVKRWIPGNGIDMGVLAYFLIAHGETGRGIYLLEKLKESGENLYPRALYALMKIANQSIREGNLRYGEWLLKKIFALDPLFDNLAVRLAGYYRSHGREREAEELLRFYKTRFPDYVITDRLENFLKKDPVYR